MESNSYNPGRTSLVWLCRKEEASLETGCKGSFHTPAVKINTEKGISPVACSLNTCFFSTIGPPQAPTAFLNVRAYTDLKKISCLKNVGSSQSLEVGGTIAGVDG